MNASPAGERPRPTGLRALVSLAWPVILARATQSVIGFCDALLVAPLGEDSLAAATTGALNSLSVMMLPMGTVFIVQSFASQLRGRGDALGVARYAWYGLGLSVAAAVFAAATIPLLPFLIAKLHYAPAVSSQMQTYLAIRLLSIGPAVGSEALGNWYGGLGDTRPSMIAGIVAMVVNVVAAYLLIEPHLGLPGYGVGGAAVASVGATWLGFGVLFVRFLRDRRGQPGLLQLGLKAREMLRMLRFGLPNGVNWFLEFAAFALFINLVVGHLGTTALAAFNVVMQLNSVSFMPAFGLSSAGAIMVGEAIGRKAHDEVWPTLKLTCGAACAWMGTVGLVYVAGSSTLMRWFQPQDLTSSSFAAIGTRILGFSALWQLCDAITMSCSETLRAAGDTAWCMAARITLAWVFFLPISWAAIFYLGGGVGTAMGVLVAYMVALSATMALRFASGKWRSIDLVEAEPSVL